MQRRGFLRLLGGLATTVAIDQVIPLNRVWSFPKEIKLLSEDEIRDIYINPAAIQLAAQIDWINCETLLALERNLKITNHFRPRPYFDEEYAIGSKVNIRMPQHFLTWNEETF